MNNKFVHTIPVFPDVLPEYKINKFPENIIYLDVNTNS